MMIIVWCCDFVTHLSNPTFYSVLVELWNVQVSPHDTSSDTDPSQMPNYWKKKNQKRWEGKKLLVASTCKIIPVLGLIVVPLLHLLLISSKQLKHINNPFDYLIEQINILEVWVDAVV